MLRGRGPGPVDLLVLRWDADGWSWAMAFAQEAMSVPARKVAPTTAEGVSGLHEEGRPVPRLGPQAPVVSIYVDNACIGGWNETQTNKALDSFLDLCTESGLVVGDRERASMSAECAGLVLCASTGLLHHKPERVWMVYRSIRFLRRFQRATSHNIEVVVGHLVSYFMLNREGLVCLHYRYEFIRQHLADNLLHRMSPRLLDELRLVQGLIFIFGAPRTCLSHRVR